MEAAHLPRTSTTRGDVGRQEVVVVAGLFVFACFEFLRVDGTEPPVASRVAGGLLFALLAGCYLGLSIEPVRRYLRQAVSPGMHRRVAGPAILLICIAIYTVASGASLLSQVVPYAVYLLLPLALLIGKRDPAEQRPIRQLTAAVLLWLPITFGLPRLRLNGGYDATHLVGIVAGLYYFLILEPLEGIGYTFRFGGRDWISAGAALVTFVAVGAPLGLSSGFLVWHPRLDPENLMVTPWHIYLMIAVPEELLFRGIIQNVCMRWMGGPAGLIVASIVFGLAHLPDARYVILATLAGAAYGWVYWRTEKITASAITHATVDWIWKLAFRR